MPRLTVTLEEGFNGEAVRARVNGTEVFRHEGLRTRMQVWRAGAFDVDLPPGDARLEIDLPGKGTSFPLDLEIASEPVFVGISLDRAGAVRHWVASKPRGYV